MTSFFRSPLVIEVVLSVVDVVTAIDVVPVGDRRLLAKRIQIAVLAALSNRRSDARRAMKDVRSGNAALRVIKDRLIGIDVLVIIKGLRTRTAVISAVAVVSTGVIAGN